MNNGQAAVGVYSESEPAPATLGAMAKATKPRSELVLVAEALEEEIARMEVMSRSVRRIRLNSEENLTHAAEQLNEALGLPERMAPRLQALSAAMARLQERQTEALEPLAMFATAIQTRRRRLEEHMSTFAALGKAAGGVSADLEAGSKDDVAIARAKTQMQEVADKARALFESAHADDFPEVAREADVLKQRMIDLRKRLAQGK
jgi:hypothetical protein